jgi:uncharacterized phage-associated protein
MNISLAKLKAIILYFAQNTNPQYLGKVKLMKLFYYLDFNHVKKYGTSVTGDTYFHLEKGPIPTTIMNMVGELANDPELSKLADDITIETPAGTKMLRIKGLREFSDNDAALFTESEIQTLQEVVKTFGDDSTDEIVESSHAESPWRETKYGQSIPYELAAHDSNSDYSEDDIRFLTSVAK